jgi:alpha-amylase
MWPEDLRIMVGRLNSLPTDHGFPSGAKPFVFQEVIDFGEDSIPASQYTGHGRVTEFKAAANIAEVIRKNDNQQLKYLKNWGEGWGFNPEGKAVVFVDNHDNQRSVGNILTFRVPRMYKMAQAFFLAWPYGVTRVMSSFYWEQDFQNGRDENDWTGPPHDANFNILPVAMNPDLSCGNGWVCEHRWRQIFNMARFRNVVQGTAVEGWWDNQSNQIAFSRGNRGFIAINNDNFDLDRTFNTGLPGGIYCDVISGSLNEGTCSGKFIPVGNDGSAQISISSADEDPIVAIHVEARL